MRLLPTATKLFKTALLLPALLSGMISVRAQDNVTTNNLGGNIKEIEIKGSVRDAATRLPLRAIRVTYQDYSAAITDSTGSFSLKVPNDNVTVLLQGEGYQLKEVAVKGRTFLSVSLFEDTYTSFYDAANLPFKSRSINRIPFAVASVQGTRNWAHSAETPDAYLQGKVAGLNMIRRSGTPNVGADIFLRGISSLYTNNQPLIVVDGVIYDNTDYGGSLISNNYTNPLAYIDIKDIDNISVIKDGSSTYGTKGANGVINITTARAKGLGTRIDVGAFGGVS